MATGESRPLARHLEQLWYTGTVSGLSDAELVKRFTSSVRPTAEAAFETLLGRHGPMVLGVCRHILRRPQDVDDAFQATFLVLVRKARSIRIDESLGPWLYGVAYKTAMRARSKAARHHLEEMDDLEGAAADPASGAFACEVRPMLHEELNRLPEKYRSPIVLCHLEGKSHEEAARMLDWPVGTLSGRLSRGRQLLRDRLQRRGLTASAGMLAAWFPGETIAVLPPRLVELTIKSALGSGAGPTVSTSVLTLTQGVLNAMLIHGFKRAALILVSVAAMTAAFGFRAAWLPAILGAGVAAAPPRQAETKPTTKPVAPKSVPVQNPGAPSIEPAAKADRTLDPFDALEMIGVTPKNSPNMATMRDPFSVFGSQSILMVESPDGKGVAAMSTEAGNGEWKRYQWPAGQTGTGITRGRCAELHNERRGHHRDCGLQCRDRGMGDPALAQPDQRSRSPPSFHPAACSSRKVTISMHSVPRKGHLGRAQLAGRREAACPLTTAYITVQQGDQVFVFPLKLAKWSKGISAKPAKLPQTPKPIPVNR